MGKEIKIYRPKLLLQKYKYNKLIEKEIDLLGDYLFCYHKDFADINTINKIQFTPGLKYFLDGFKKSQEEIKKFIEKCQTSENQKGYLSTNFFNIYLNSKYKFVSGPFTEMIFKIININKNKIQILLGDFKTIVNKKDYLFRPV